MYQRFSGKTVVITGACRGIGAGIAERFAQEGANLVLASNDLERVTFTSEQLASEYSVNSLALGIDVTDEADIQRLYQSAHERFGSIDVSVQNAASSPSTIAKACPAQTSTRSCRSTPPASGSAAGKPPATWLNKATGD